jgi:hypothetical protein
MSPLKNSLFAALVSAAVTAGCLYAVHHRRAEEAARMRYANNRMLRLEADRIQSVQAPARNAAAEPSAAAAAVSTDRPASNPAPAGDYRNEGHATPLATLQTFAWACDRGDNETVAKLLCFDPTGRAKALEYMATLPANSHPQWSTPEEMAAAILTSQTMEHPFPNATILDTASVEQIGEDRVILHLPGTARDHTMYQKTDDGWKLVVTDAMVGNYLASVNVPPGTSAK